ncbi:uncharacterized protein A1O9_07153 [Exophiala aquamarina CBS 119918]|uniref:Uncharacterized protein n=1 Tax=Exophiala aquamarina CBS 119918 TaxID=1182545 RepID=A0A072PCE3_9EURO|nr:uncharacterized protein A1O9_07153 [Exophiala aquamarina CBS 119918]KEF56963.1 hypothetical protein A1O9_07153 [Exophiala aquamarina CBS 119918]
MVQDLLTLPYDIRRQIWEYVLGPSKLKPCKCVIVQSYCTITHLGSCFGEFDLHEHCDNRILRVCRAIYDEVHPMMVRSPKIFTICSGICLDSLFSSISVRERSSVRRVNVKVYIGRLREGSLEGISGAALLKQAESWCGPFVQNALKCAGAGDIVDAKVISNVNEDTKLRRTIWLALQLAPDTQTSAIWGHCIPQTTQSSAVIG